jgi:putative ABC transport system permease protein
MQTAASASRPSAIRSREALNLFAADSIQLSATAAEKLHATVGDTVTVQVGVQSVPLTITGIVPSTLYSQDVGLMDIAAAQWKLDRLGKLNRIELRLASNVDPKPVLAEIKRLLPANVKLTTPAEESQQVSQLTRPITINLLGVALVALFTGVFLVYSTQSLAVMRRRREFALLNALGVTAREQVTSVILTGGILGAVGAVLGVVLGVTLAQVTLQFIPGGATQLQYAFTEIAAFAVLGMVASITGSIAPALSAARIPTAQALKAGNVDERSDRGNIRVALALVVLAVPLLLAPPLFDLPLFGYTAIAFILFGAVLLIPSFTRWTLGLLPHGRHVSYQIAVAQLRGVAHTATTSVATMLVSVSLMVAMSIMGASLRGSMAQWAEQMFPADIVVQTGYGLSYLNVSSVHSLTEIVGVKRAEPSRTIPILLSQDRAPITLNARPTTALILEASAQQPIPAGELPIWINRVIADRENLSPDDSFRFHIADREVVGSVRGITRDYFNPNGALILDYDLYRQLTGDLRVSSLSVWLAPGASLENTTQAIRERIGRDIEVEISLPGDLRARVLRGFDSLFAIIYLLLAVAVLIGLFGIGVNASAQVLSRRAEFGVLRHLGLTRSDIGAVLSIEGLSLGALGMLAGLIVGCVISAVMIYVVTPQSFHWTMELYVPIGFLISLTIAVPAAAALTAFWSGHGAMNDDVVRAVKEDW